MHFNWNWYIMSSPQIEYLIPAAVWSECSYFSNSYFFISFLSRIRFFNITHLLISVAIHDYEQIISMMSHFSYAVSLSWLLTWMSYTRNVDYHLPLFNAIPRPRIRFLYSDLIKFRSTFVIVFLQFFELMKSMENKISTFFRILRTFSFAHVLIHIQIIFQQIMCDQIFIRKRKCLHHDCSSFRTPKSCISCKEELNAWKLNS